MSFTQNTDLLNKIRKKTAGGPWVFLIDFYDKDEVESEHLTNYFENVTYNERDYNQYPFVVSLPTLDESLGSQVIITFPNAKVNGSDISIKDFLDNISKVRINFGNLNFLDAVAFDPIFYFFSNGDSIFHDNGIVSISLSKRKIGDVRFPFRRYNSTDHELIYEDYSDEITNR